ncbi:hypothetical protein ACHAXS_006109 [Conticribra weissflogii]
MQKYNPEHPLEMSPPPPSTPIRPHDITPYIHFPHSSFSSPRASFPPHRYCYQQDPYYLPHVHAYGHMHLSPESCNYYSPQWHVHPPAYYQELVGECPRDVPATQHPVDITNTSTTYNTQPLPFLMAGQSSSGDAATARSCDHQSAFSIETQTSFYPSTSTGSGLFLRCAYFVPMSSSRRHGDGSGVSARNKQRKGSGSSHASNKRGVIKRTSSGSGSGDGSTKSRSPSAVVTNSGIRFDEKSKLLQIKGHIVRIAKDRDGSRFIQQRLDYLADHKSNCYSWIEEMDLVFSEAMFSIEDLWNDVHGNFVLQKLLDHGTEEMKAQLGDRFHSDVVSLSTMVHGCRVIQRALDTLPKDKVVNLVSTFEGRVLTCIRDHSGNHVIQKIVIVISNFAKAAREQDEDEKTSSFYLEILDPIINEIIHDIEVQSRHPYGCRVVQRTLEHCIEPQKSKILDSITSHLSSLVNDQYGNYVVQRILVHGREEDRDAIFEMVSRGDSVVRLSMQKRASNVVEMMLKRGTESQRRTLIQEMLDNMCIDDRGNAQSAIVTMSMDCYANYVVKTVIDVAESGNQKDQIYGLLAPQLNELVSGEMSFGNAQKAHSELILNYNVSHQCHIFHHLVFHRKKSLSRSILFHLSSCILRKQRIVLNIITIVVKALYI